MFKHESVRLTVSHALCYSTKCDLLTVGGDAHDTAAIKGSPGASTILLGNGEVPNTDDVLILTSSGRETLDFLTITGVELNLPGGTIFLLKLNRNDGGTRVFDQGADKSGFVHLIWRGVFP